MSSRNMEMIIKMEECDFYFWEGLIILSCENDIICSLLYVSNWNYGFMENLLCFFVVVCYWNEIFCWDFLYMIKNFFEILLVLIYD